MELWVDFLIMTFLKANWFTPQGIRSIRTISIINIVFTLISASSGGNISVWGHMGGLVFGIILTYLLIPDYPNSLQRYKDHIDPRGPQEGRKSLLIWMM